MLWWGTLGNVTPCTHGSGTDRLASFSSILAPLDPGWLHMSLSSPAQPPGLLASASNQTQAHVEVEPVLRWIRQPLTEGRAQLPEGFCRACLEINKVNYWPKSIILLVLCGATCCSAYHVCKHFWQSKHATKDSQDGSVQSQPGFRKFLRWGSVPRKAVKLLLHLALDTAQPCSPHAAAHGPYQSTASSTETQCCCCSIPSSANLHLR